MGLKAKARKDPKAGKGKGKKARRTEKAERVKKALKGERKKERKRQAERSKRKLARVSSTSSGSRRSSSSSKVARSSESKSNPSSSPSPSPSKKRSSSPSRSYSRCSSPATSAAGSAQGSAASSASSSNTPPPPSRTTRRPAGPVALAVTVDSSPERAPAVALGADGSEESDGDLCFVAERPPPVAEAAATVMTGEELSRQPGSATPAQDVAQQALAAVPPATSEKDGKAHVKQGRKEAKRKKARRKDAKLKASPTAPPVQPAGDASAGVPAGTTTTAPTVEQDATASSGPDDDGDDAAAAAVGRRRLAESALYRESVLEHGHSEVWGSWFDMSTQRWGYACCRGLARGAECSRPEVGDSKTPLQPLAAPPLLTYRAQHGAAPLGLGGLQPRESFGDDAVAFIAHWTEAVLQEWGAKLREEAPEVVSNPRFGTREQLEEAEKAVYPLVQLLWFSSPKFFRGQVVHVWSVGNAKWMRDGYVLDVLEAETCITGSRTVADGSKLPAGSVLVSFNGGNARKWITPDQLEGRLRKPRRVELGREAIEKLERIAALSAAREYHAANQAYIELTMGHGKWHADLSLKSMTGCNKAPRHGLTIKRDQVSFMETEEAREYTLCLKRLVAFLQLVRPNEDVSKHFT